MDSSQGRRSSSVSGVPEAILATFAALCSETPAVHRFPGSMAKRVQELCRALVERYDGQAANIWRDQPTGAGVKAALAQLQAEYAPRGVNLVRVANKWTFRTAGDLSWLMTRESTETRRLSRAAIEQY